MTWHLENRVQQVMYDSASQADYDDHHDTFESMPLAPVVRDTGNTRTLLTARLSRHR